LAPEGHFGDQMAEYDVLGECHAEINSIDVSNEQIPTQTTS
jgi:hypothetical protein